MKGPFNFSKQTTHKTTHLVPNIIEASSSSLPPNLLNQLSYNQSNFINNSARTTKSPPLFDPKDLISNNNDDEKTLQQKNKRLIQLVVQSSSKIAELNESKKQQEEQHNIEKQDWLIKLDKITNNYKTYAESYQNYTIIKDEFEALQQDFEESSNILKHYEVLIKLVLTDLFTFFKKINSYLSSDELISDCDLTLDYFLKIREELKEKILSHSEKINKNNFEDLLKEIESLKGNIHAKEIKSIYPVKPNVEFLKSESLKKGNKQEPFTKKENYKQTRHVRQRSCDSASKSNFYNDDPKIRKLNESKQEIKNLTNEVSNNIEKIFNNYKNPSNQYPRDSAQQTKNNNHGELNENSEYTPQFINLEDKQKITATALYDFIPQRKTELGFKRGDIIEIEIIKDNGWWQGILNGERGFIPYNYIRINE